MRIFILWRRQAGPGQDLEPERVARSLKELLGPLFSPPPPVQIEQNDVAAMVFLHLPVRGWNAPFVEEDEQGRAYVVDYPINARRVLEARGVEVKGDRVLPALARQLHAEPRHFLRELAPPFSLVWWPRYSSEVLLQTDGLGQAQVFEYDDGRLWAATNKITALQALGVHLEPDPLDWAHKCTHGWFPMAQSGFRNIVFASPGTQVRLDRGGIQRREVDVLREWVHPARMSQEECLELARSSLIQHIRAGAPHWARPTAELSGGWDSRAVVSTFVAAGVDLRVRVKGQEGKFDVAISRKLAKIAGLELEVEATAELPPERTEDLERCIRLALLWQAGHMWSQNHHSFLWGKRHLDGGRLNVMGQHGEIGRGYYERRVRACEAKDEREYEERVLAFLMKKRKAATYMRTAVREAVRERIRESYSQAERWGLTGLAALDFLYLFERTRRNNGASVNRQPGLAFTPFLNPDYIRATYAFRTAGGVFVRDERQVNPLPRYIIETNLPEWRGVDFEEDVIRATRESRNRGALEASRADASRDWRPAQGKDYYHYDLYWQEVGAPLAHRVTSRDGFWAEIFDPALLRARDDTPPVEVVLVQLMAESLGHAPAE